MMIKIVSIKRIHTEYISRLSIFDFFVHWGLLFFLCFILGSMSWIGPFWFNYGFDIQSPLCIVTLLFLLNLMMEYWDIEIRFWDIRVFLDKNRHLLLNLEKIRERHKDSCDCYYVFLLLFYQY